MLSCLLASVSAFKMLFLKAKLMRAVYVRIFLVNNKCLNHFTKLLFPVAVCPCASSSVKHL